MIPPPKPGQTVRIAEGTFKGFVGTVVEANGAEAPVQDYSGDAGVVVSLNVFGRQAPIVVDPASLEPA